MMIMLSHLVGPLSHSYAAAGFFPKSSELDSEGPKAASSGEVDDRKRASRNDDDNADDPEQRESVYSQTKYWLIDDSSDGRKKLNKQFLDCTQTMNLRNNFLYWDSMSKEKQQQQ